MPESKFEVQEIMDSLATVSAIIFRRLQCMECNIGSPCGEVFMNALKVLSEAGNVPPLEGGATRGEE